MYIFCENCLEKCLTFDGWMEHLFSDGHQQITKSLRWTKQMNDRSLVVQNVNKTTKIEDVGWYFASHGLLADFYSCLVKGRMAYILQFDSRDIAQKCLEEDHIIEGATLTLNWKDDKVLGIFPSGAKANFQNRHHELNQTLATLPMQLQLPQFMKSTSLTEQHYKDRDFVMRELTEIIKIKYKYCVLYPFGSTITGLGDVDSDIDICVDLKGNFNRDTAYSSQGDDKMIAFNAVLSIMRRHCENQQWISGPNNVHILNSVYPIRHARVPIIQIIHQKTGIKCDLSFENLLSVQNSKMIKFYTTLDPRVRPLIHLVRYWGRYHDLTGSVQIKNYTLILLVLTFLQKKRIVPTVHFLQTMPGNKEIIIDGWDASFCDNKEAVLAAFNASREKIPDGGTSSGRSILNLAYECFEMYANIDFQTQVVSSLLGKFIGKRSFEKFEVLPNEMNRYKQWFVENQQHLDKKDLLRLDCPLCVPDPFNLSFNVGSCASEYIVYKFQKACKETAERIKGMLTNPDFEHRECVTDICFPVLD